MRKRIGICQLPRLLHRQGITQQQLADRTGFSPTQISDYVTNRRMMSLTNATIIAGVLGCRVEDLYQWVEATDQSGDE